MKTKGPEWHQRHDARISGRRLVYLARFVAEPIAFVRRKRLRPAWDEFGRLIWVRAPRPARHSGNALLSRLL